MKIDRRKLLAGAAAGALSSPAYGQFAIFQLNGAASPPPPPPSGGFGAPQLQIGGVFSTTNRALSEANVQDYSVPGNESPAIATDDYYHMSNLQFMRPYDLDACGAAGAAAKAANGNNRYVWFASCDHPEGGTGVHADAYSLVMGFSNDPGVFPSAMVCIIPYGGYFDGTGLPGPGPYLCYFDHAPSSFVYNPDDASFPFYLYTQLYSQAAHIAHQSGIWKSSDLFDWQGVGVGPCTVSNNVAVQDENVLSYQSVARNGTGDWQSWGLVGQLARAGNGNWTSTDGLTWTCNNRIFNLSGFPSENFTLTSGAMSRLTAASAIFSSADGENGISLFDYPGNTSNTVYYLKTTYVSTTELDVNIQYPYYANNPYSYSSSPAVVEIVPNISYQAWPNPMMGQSRTFTGLYRPTFSPGDDPTQLWAVTQEDARANAFNPEDGMWVTRVAVDAANNVSQSIPAVRLSSQYDGFYPGPGYVSVVVSYVEDGICHIYAECGYAGPHGTSSLSYVGATVTGGVAAAVAGFSDFTVDSISMYGGYVPIGGFVQGSALIGYIVSQTSGTPNGAGVYVVENPSGATIAAHTANIFVNAGSNYLAGTAPDNGYFGHQFIDYYTLAFDSGLAARAAPFGVTVSCNNNTVTISWMDTPLEMGSESQAYNVYRGTTSGSQTTQVGTTTSMLSVTDTPMPGQQYWYKVVKVSGGVEYASANRVVHTYVG